MYRDLLNAICCPVCRSAFRLEEQTVVDDEVIEGILTCGEGQFMKSGKINWICFHTPENGLLK